MSEKVYVVMGSTGEYSDRSEWPVVAFMDEEKAKQRVIDAERKAKELEVTRKDRYRIEKGANEFDAEMQMDYTGTSYFYYTVGLEPAPSAQS